MAPNRRYDALIEEGSEDGENRISIPHRSSGASFYSLRNLDCFQKYFASQQALGDIWHVWECAQWHMHLGNSCTIKLRVVIEVRSSSLG